MNFHKVSPTRYFALVNGKKIDVEKAPGTSNWYFFINDYQPGQSATSTATEAKNAAIAYVSNQLPRAS